MADAMAQELEGPEQRLHETFAEVMQRRLSRRGFLKGALASAPLLVVGPSMLGPRARAAASEESRLTFQPIELSAEDRVIVSPGYAVKVLIRWGDPLHPDVPTFDIRHQTAELQAQQFGYNCDFVAYFPLSHHLSRHLTRGILAVNHEYTNPELMFLGYVPGSPTQEQVDVELAAHGVTFVEVVRLPLGGWQYHLTSDFNCRITGESEIEIAGPAAGHDWLKVSYDPSGTRVRGTLNNCAGGVTPWGTYLTCIDGIDHIKANPITGNILILYRPDRIGQHGVLSALRRLGCLQARDRAQALTESSGDTVQGLSGMLAETLVRSTMELALQRLVSALI